MLGAHLHLPLPCADDQPEALYCAAYAKLLLKQGIHSELNGRKALNLRYSVRLVLLTGFMTALLTMRKLRSPLSVAEAESCFIEFPQFFNPPVSCHSDVLILRGDFRLLALCFQRLPPLLWLASSFVAEIDFFSLLSL